VALLNYLERYRQHSPLTEREVSRVCGVTAEGTTTSALVDAARQFGLTNATARVLTLAELDRTRLPVIVSISTLPTVHHATLLVSLDENEAGFIDPAYGTWKISRERFRQIWYGKTVRFE
jgi:ABC-type bacteriocin/lantibiotic exporter with double-glycine peptidase domain